MDRRSEVRIGEVCLGEPRPCEVRLWSLAPERFAPERSAPWRLARCASKPGTVWYGLRAVKRGGTAIREPPYSIVMTVTVVTLSLSMRFSCDDPSPIVLTTLIPPSRPSSPRKRLR